MIIGFEDPYRKVVLNTWTVTSFSVQNRSLALYVNCSKVMPA